MIQISELIHKSSYSFSYTHINISDLKSKLDAASIIPPFSGQNLAICVGREPGQGISHGSIKQMDCPSNSIKVFGAGGENDVGGDGLVAEPPFYSVLPVTTIEDCETACINYAGPGGPCRGFNWFGKYVNGYPDHPNVRCEIYAQSEPNNVWHNNGPTIFCQMRGPICQIGEIIILSGDDLPDGYVLAAGQAIDSQEFSEFCDVLPDHYPQKCVVPDLRGKFVRGAGSPTVTLGEGGGDDTLSIKNDKWYHY